VLGVGPHQDGTFITILKQDDNVSGLQVYKGPGDEMNIDPTQWVTIPPVKNALVVNVGAMLEVWSNLKYKAALHRVIANNNLPRYSVPFFFTHHLMTLLYAPSSRMEKPLNIEIYSLGIIADFCTLDSIKKFQLKNKQDYLTTAFKDCSLKKRHFYA